MKLTIGPDGRPRPSHRKADNLTSADRKKIILQVVTMGFTVEEGCRQAGCGIKAHEYYKRKDPAYRDAIEMAIRAKRERSADARAEVPDFPEFSEKYLGARLFRHQLQWYDLLQGKDPRDLRPNQRFIRGDPDMIVINTPPDHSKSTTITQNYVTWRVVQDPNVRIVIVSKTQGMARQFLLAVRERLAESETFSELQARFAPFGGFAEGAASWSADKIYVNGRDAGQKDPTVQALGIRGHIYGTRADLIVMDDCVTLDNVREYEKQIEWIQKEVNSRVAADGGRILLVGTRMDTTDLYSEILKSKYYADGESPWTYLTQPAVESFAPEAKDWVTLWPETNMPPPALSGRKEAMARGWPKDGMWPARDGYALSKQRRKVSARSWSLVYMQEQVADDAVFPEEDVLGCIDAARYAGKMVDGLSQHRRFGMDGLVVIAGLDPADVGYTAAVIVGLDRRTGVRWVLDIFNQQGCKPHELRRMIKEKTERYGISEWKVEKNAFQGSLIQDEDLKSYLNARGCLLSGHFTDARKWDHNYGVASMAPLFTGHKDGNNLIRLPSRHNSEGVKALIEQLVTWAPVPMGHKVAGHWDTVMALWFAEIRCRELMGSDLDGFHLTASEFASQRDEVGQVTIDIDWALQNQGLVAWNGSLS